MTVISNLASLFVQILLPILLIVALGALVQRHHPLDMNTLSKLQIYLFVPVFLFVRVFDSQLTAAQIGGIALSMMLAMTALGLPVWLSMRRIDIAAPTAAAVVLSGTVFNAGNFGIPLIQSAFGTKGGAVQALVVMVSNLTLWGIGYGVMALMHGKGKKALLEYFRFPMVYVLIAAFILRGLHFTMPAPLKSSLDIIADGLVPLALVTLGAQLALQARWPRWRIVIPVLILKLLLMPVVTAVIVYFMGLWPWPGAVLIVASAAPTAVNTLLIALEQGGDVELAADCVFWTTLLSGVTVTIVLAVVTALGGVAPR